MTLNQFDIPQPSTNTCRAVALAKEEPSTAFVFPQPSTKNPQLFWPLAKISFPRRCPFPTIPPCRDAPQSFPSTTGGSLPSCPLLSSRATVEGSLTILHDGVRPYPDGHAET